MHPLQFTVEPSSNDMVERDFSVADVPGVGSPASRADRAPLMFDVIIAGCDLVARASRNTEMSKTPGITDANPQQRLVFDLYGYLPEALALVYAPAPLPTPATP